MSEDHNTGWRKRQIALDKKAENARELGLDYEPNKTVVEMMKVEQEPVAWMDADGNVSDNNDHKCFPIPLYTTTQPQRKPLTYSKLCEQEPVQYKCTVIDSQYANGTPHTRVGLFEIISGKFQEGRTEAFAEIAEKVKSMPWESDTKDSFLVWLQEQQA